MSDDNVHVKIAKERDLQAAAITDVGVYRSVVENIVSLDAELSDKIDFLLDAVPDIGIIIAQLSLCKKRGLLSDEDYNGIFNQCMLNLQRRRKPVDFNPNYLGKFEDGR